MENFKDNNYEKISKNYVEIYDPGSWDIIKEKIMNIENQAFNNIGFSAKTMQDIFENKENLNFIIKEPEKKEIIGYLSVIILDNDKSAYIMNTAISPKYQGQGNVAILMKKMEEELKKRAIKYLIRDVSVENGYADKVQKQYADRIITDKVYEHPSPWGIQRHFEIKL